MCRAVSTDPEQPWETLKTQQSRAPWITPGSGYLVAGAADRSLLHQPPGLSYLLFCSLLLRAEAAGHRATRVNAFHCYRGGGRTRHTAVAEVPAKCEAMLNRSTSVPARFSDNVRLGTLRRLPHLASHQGCTKLGQLREEQTTPPEGLRKSLMSLPPITLRPKTGECSVTRVRH